MNRVCPICYEEINTELLKCPPLCDDCYNYYVTHCNVFDHVMVKFKDDLDPSVF